MAGAVESSGKPLKTAGDLPFSAFQPIMRPENYYEVSPLSFRTAGQYVNSGPVAGGLVSDSHFQNFELGGVVRCGARARNCRQCGRHYTKADNALISCPDCQCDRRCLKTIGSMTRCRLHGGKSPIGPASATFKHGKDSKYAALAAPLRERLTRIESDPDINSIRTELSLATARMQILAERLHSGESGSLWKQLNESWTEVVASFSSGDAMAVRDAIKRHGDILKLGEKDEATWKEVMEATQDSIHVKQLDYKRQMELQTVLRADEAAAFAIRIMEAVTRNVTDKAVLSRIGMEIHRLLNVGDDRPRAGGVPGAGMIGAGMIAARPTTTPPMAAASSVVEGRAVRSDRVDDSEDAAAEELDEEELDETE